MPLQRQPEYNIMMVLKEANNAGTTGHVVTAVEKEQWHASACKLAMQVVKILR